MELSTFLFYLIVIAIPLSTRTILGSVIPGFHEYEAIFVYASDLLMLAYLLTFIFNSHKRHHGVHEKSFKKLFVPLYIFLSVALISVYYAPSFHLAIADFLRLVLLVAFAVSVPIMMRLKDVFTNTLIIISLIGLLQAGIGMYQFSQQGSVGLGLLGEPQLVSYTGSASTIHAEGGRVLRSYGTLPHPNIYGALILLSLISLCYLYLLGDTRLYEWNYRASVYKNFKTFITNPYFYLRLLMSAGLFILILGLVLSFSRSAWIGAVVATTALLLVASLRGYLRPALRLLFVLLISSAAIIYLLYPIVAPRAEVSVGQPAVDYRLTYNSVALDVLAHNPFGVGIGNQVLYSVETGTFTRFGLMRVWEWEPIHNLYLLIASEIGIIGLLSFLAFLAIVVWHALRHSGGLAQTATLSLLIGFLVLGLFDHYLWTIQPGRLMLWLVIGLALSHFQTEPRSKI